MNIPGLITIEYIETTSTAIPVYETVTVSESVFTDDFIPIDFVATTGGFTATTQRDGAGNLYHETSLSFFVPEPSAVAKTELNTLVEQKCVFKVTDPQGIAWVIGDQSHPCRVVYTEQVDPNYTGKRGYAVTATCANITGPLIMRAADGDSSSS